MVILIFFPDKILKLNNAMIVSLCRVLSGEDDHVVVLQVSRTCGVVPSLTPWRLLSILGILYQLQEQGKRNLYLRLYIIVNRMNDL